jgi:hypothetical protein
MENKQTDQISQPADNKSKLLICGERENPEKFPGLPLPYEPNTPTLPDANPDITKPGPGRNEPEKNDPTRIVQPPAKQPEKLIK